MKEIILSFSNLEKRFNKKTVLDNLSLDIAKGEIMGIIGKSGCGKTVLLRTLFGFLKPDSGQIFFMGKDVTKSMNVVKTRIGFATQDDTFYPKLTVKENMNYYARLYGIKKRVLKAKTEELLDLFKLEEYTNMVAERLSGGMKKRLCLAISLIHDPDVFLLDEPTVGLDPVLREEVWSWIKKINLLGKTVIVVSHLFEELEQNCDRIAVMNNGRFMTVGYQKTYGRLWPGASLNKIFENLVKFD
jgi:ABC-2 type transport system ATP-binding protein